MSLIVYTAITRGYDSLHPVPRAAMGGALFLSFLEEDTAPIPWGIAPLERRSTDANRDAKRYKILPHVSLPPCDYSLWIDGKLELVMQSPVTELLSLLTDVDLVIFRHPRRRCAYHEAAICKQLKLDSARSIDLQMERYRQEGFPQNQGLCDAQAILRRHSPSIQTFNESWWEEIIRGSRRDQLSFPYIAWKQKLAYGFFPGSPESNPFFRRHAHLATADRTAHEIDRWP